MTLVIETPHRTLTGFNTLRRINPLSLNVHKTSQEECRRQDDSLNVEVLKQRNQSSGL